MHKKLKLKKRNREVKKRDRNNEEAEAAETLLANNDSSKLLSFRRMEQAGLHVGHQGPSMGIRASH